MLNKRLTVFISSTSKDLVYHREAARDILNRLNYFTVVMEQFGAIDADAKQASLKKIAEADVVICVVAWRYGFIPQGDAESVTHQEINEAIRLNKHCLVFLANKSTENQTEETSLFPLSRRDYRNRGRLQKFRGKLELIRVVDYFTTPDDLAKRVATAMFPYSPRKISLPFITRDFVGRDRELKNLIKICSRRENVAIVGMGGIGKSSLASEVLKHIALDQKNFPGGINWISCYGLQNNDGLTTFYSKLIYLLDISSSNAGYGTAEQIIGMQEIAVRKALDASKVQLLFLDDIDPLFPMSRVIQLLSSLGITILLTSRALSTAPQIVTIDLDVLDIDSGISLFKNRSTSRGGSWIQERDEQNTRTIVELLGRLPLAIELAASRAGRQKISTMSILMELQKPEILLILKDPLQKEMSIRYSLGKSLNDLESNSRFHFALMSLLEYGTFPYEIIYTMFKYINIDESSNVDDDLDLFLTLSLIKLTNSMNDNSKYVDLHILLYKIAEDAWKSYSRAIKDGALSKLLEIVYGYLQSCNNNPAIILKEEKLILGLIDKAIKEEVGLEIALSIIDLFRNYFVLSGRLQKGIEVNHKYLTIAKALNNREHEKRALLNLGGILAQMSRFKEAKEFYLESLKIAKELNDISSQGRLLHNLGTIETGLGNTIKAKDLYMQSMSIKISINDVEGLGSTINSLAYIAIEENDFDKANDLLQESLRIRILVAVCKGVRWQ